MSDYTNLCARLRHNCECDSETMYQCDSCTAAYAIKSQAAEIAAMQARVRELDPDPEVCNCREALCPHTPIAKMPRAEMVKFYRAEIAALRARAEAAEKAIKDHNDGCVAACEARQRGDYGQDCSAWISRKKRCLDCARDSMIDYGSEMFHVKHSQTNQEGL